ncbi:MAG: ABC transporter ATP-binding protein [Bdellovibrionales bacterium]
MTTVIQVENVSKRYRLGTVGTGTAAEDFQRWFARAVLRRPPEELTLPQNHHGNIDGDILWALRDISFKINEGEIVGIIGRNGAGKSTLLKIMSQITAPSSGTIRYKGRLASLLEVGTGFNGELTGRENIFLNGCILGMTPREIRRRFDEIVDFAEIGDFIDTPVKRYSSGMFVRLAFAVAAHLETEIMVVDEVLAVGDIGFQKKCIGKMSQASYSGRTILFVSHRMDHISALCSRSIVLKAGHKVFEGPTEDALGCYYRLFENEAGGDVATRTDRRGRGRVRLTDVWIENGHGDRVETLVTGQPAMFKLRLESTDGRPVANLNAGIAIFNLGNMFVTSMSTQEGGIYSFDMDGASMLVTLRTDRLSLNSGQFYLNASVRSSTGAYEYEDFLENILMFSIDYGDFHGIGQSSGGFMSIAHRAELSGTTQKMTGTG